LNGLIDIFHPKFKDMNFNTLRHENGFTHTSIQYIVEVVLILLYIVFINDGDSSKAAVFSDVF